MKALTLLVIFLIFPLTELYLLIKVGGEIGALITVGWVILSGVLGILLIRYQGLKVLDQAKTAMLNLQAPKTQAIEGLIVFIGGILLVLPGLISDLLGLILMLPFVRKPLANHLLSQAVKTQTGEAHFYGEWVVRTTRNENLIIEGEAYEKDDPNNRLEDR